MDARKSKEERKQITTLKTLLIIAFGLALLVTAIVTIVNDKDKGKNKKEEEKVVEKQKEETK